MRTTPYNLANEEAMPLIMNFTVPTSVSFEEEQAPIMYDPMSQVVSYDARSVGTRCLKVRGTQLKVGAKTDRINEIDDSKMVR